MPTSLTELTEQETRYHVPNLVRALRAMELLAEEPRALSISEIARRLEVPKNSVFRIVSTLADHGYLSRDSETKTYRLSHKLLSLASTVIDADSLLEKSLDVLHALRDVTGETALVGALSGDQGVVLAQAPSRFAVKVQVEIGRRFPFHTAAPAKAILAYLPEAECERLIEGIDFEQFTEHTIRSADVLRNELAEVRRRGFALDRGEEVIEVGCVAAPVLDHHGIPIGAIWITGPRSRMDSQGLEHFADAVVEKAAVVSGRMGYQSKGRREIEGSLD